LTSTIADSGSAGVRGEGKQKTLTLVVNGPDSLPWDRLYERCVVAITLSTTRRPRALTPASSWGALVTLLSCQVWHGKERGEDEPTIAIRAIIRCRERFVRRAFKNIFCTLPAPRSPARLVQNVFFKPYTTKIPSHLGAGACIFRSVWRRGGYGRVNDGTWVLELAAEYRETPLWYGACLTSTNTWTSRWPKEGRHDNISEENYRDGRSGEVWRRRSGSTTAGKPRTDGFA
jgi:hypothetical protein